MRIVAGPTQNDINSLNGLRRDDMFPALRFLMDLIRRQLQHFHQEKLDQSMAANNCSRSSLACRSERYPIIGAMSQQTPLGQALDHTGNRRRLDPQSLSQGHGCCRNLLFFERIDSFEIILNRLTELGCHFSTII